MEGVFATLTVLLKTMLKTTANILWKTSTLLYGDSPEMFVDVLSQAVNIYELIHFLYNL